MPCYHPIPAWRNATRVQLHKEFADSSPLQVPCGTCIGCRTTRAQHWALRCHLEAMDHEETCVTTLTYDDAFLPPTLTKRHFQLWLKRLRRANNNRLRYFACGEYGERHGRPHYHAILFGVPHDSDQIDSAWGLGLTHTDHVSPKAINYVCNYTTKKLGWVKRSQEERIDLETGEVYTWQPPWQLMSRRPGLGSTARQHYRSWALYAIQNGRKLSIPRYYKQSYADKAPQSEQEDTDYKKYQYALTTHSNTTTTEEYHRKLNNRETVHHAKQILNQSLRRYE